MCRTLKHSDCFTSQPVKLNETIPFTHLHPVHKFPLNPNLFFIQSIRVDSYYGSYKFISTLDMID